MVNRSKGSISKTVEDLPEIEYHPTCMANFFQSRSKIGLPDPQREKPENIDLSFPIHDTLEPYLVNLHQVTNKMIDEAMQYKPSASPDPDSLSMLIWHKVYTHNARYRRAIRHLFYRALQTDLKIPGLAIPQE